MSSLFNPNGTVPQATNATLVQIANSTATTPSTVSTVTPHGFNDGDYVVVEGHLNNANINGQWQIHVTGASSLQLIGSVGSAPGAMTGYISDYSVNPLVTLPSDGDDVDATHVNVPLEGIADTTPFLNQRVGSYRAFAMTRVVKSDTLHDASGFSTFTLTTNSTWYHLTSAAWPYVNGSSIPFNLGLHDILMIDFACRLTTSAGTFNDLALGVSFDAGSTWNVIPGTIIEWHTGAVDVQVRLAGMFIVSDLVGAGSPNSAVLGIMGNTDTNGTVFTLYGPYHMSVQHFRHNYLAVQ